MLTASQIYIGPEPGSDSDHRVLAWSPNAPEDERRIVHALTAFSGPAFRDPIFGESFSSFPVGQRQAVVRSRRAGTGARGHRIESLALLLPTEFFKAIRGDPFLLFDNLPAGPLSGIGPSLPELPLHVARFLSAPVYPHELREPLRQLPLTLLQQLLQTMLADGRLAIVGRGGEQRLIRALLWLVPEPYRRRLAFSTYASAPAQAQLSLAVIPESIARSRFVPWSGALFDLNQPPSVSKSVDPLVEFLADAVVRGAAEEIDNYLNANAQEYGIDPFENRSPAAVNYAIRRASAEKAKNPGLAVWARLVNDAAAIPGHEEDFRQLALKAATAAVAEGQLPAAADYVRAALDVAQHQNRTWEELLAHQQPLSQLLGLMNAADPFSPLLLIDPSANNQSQLLGWIINHTELVKIEKLGSRQSKWLSSLLQSPNLLLKQRIVLLNKLSAAIRRQESRSDELVLGLGQLTRQINEDEAKPQEKWERLTAIADIWRGWGDPRTGWKMLIDDFLIARTSSSARISWRSAMQREIMSEIGNWQQELGERFEPLLRESVGLCRKHGDQQLEALLVHFDPARTPALHPPQLARHDRSASPSREALAPAPLMTGPSEKTEQNLFSYYASKTVDRFFNLLAQNLQAFLLQDSTAQRAAGYALDLWNQGYWHTSYERAACRALAAFHQYYKPQDISRILEVVEQQHGLIDPRSDAEAKQEVLDRLFQRFHSDQTGLTPEARWLLIRAQFNLLLAKPDLAPAELAAFLRMAEKWKSNSTALLLRQKDSEGNLLSRKLRACALLMRVRQEDRPLRSGVLVKAFGDQLRKITDPRVAIALLPDVQLDELTPGERQNVNKAVLDLLDQTYGDAPAKGLLCSAIVEACQKSPAWKGYREQVAKAIRVFLGKSVIPVVRLRNDGWAIAEQIGEQIKQLDQRQYEQLWEDFRRR